MTPEDRIADRLLRWEEAWEHGRDIPPGELCADEPDLEPTLRERIAALKATAWVTTPPMDGDDEDAGERCDPTPKTLGGRYRIEGLIAEGGQGRVYRAHDPELQRSVAIKFPRPGRMTGPERVGSLLEEARRAAQLRHPGIVSVHDVGRDGDDCFIVSDLIDGENLADRIARHRPEHSEAARLIAEIADALHFAHAHGFVHRDIKPANILIDRHGRPLITDFGIATTADDPAWGKAATSGTLPYMAPEQVAGEAQLIEARTDLYALGVVLYEMLAGRHPHQARTPTALREQILFRSPTPLDASVPPTLAEVCLRSLAKHPADRQGTAKELADELRTALTRSGSKRPDRWSRRIILGVAILGVGSLLGVGHLRRSPSPGTPLRGRASSVAQDGVLVFDGRTRIVTPLERFAPVTMEAWVRPGRYEDHGNQFLIGSDIPTRWGLGLSISGAILSAEYVPGVIFSDRPVPLNRWSHVAAVFGERETRLYLDGHRVHVGPATQALGGTTFVIGCAGLDNPIDHFRGQVRAIRISAGERYDRTFHPVEVFQADPAEAPCRAVLIYDGGHIQDDRIIDLSGLGHHGRIERISGRSSVAGEGDRPFERFGGYAGRAIRPAVRPEEIDPQ